jgi:hypothetical protein
VDRSRQHNFQLLCITHDEEFVRFISNELAAATVDFPLPEYYFRVSRKVPRPLSRPLSDSPTRPLSQPLPEYYFRVSRKLRGCASSPYLIPHLGPYLNPYLSVSRKVGACARGHGTLSCP